MARPLPPLALLGMGIGCLIGAQALAWWADSKRPVHGGDDAKLVAAAPGEFVGTLMLGGLRGLAIDLLWLRAMGAKEGGRFYESVALFDLISQVQPRFEIVWEYMAWDLAYNIGHEAEGPDTKFAWYRQGVEAASRGATRNPDSGKLRRYLAWMLYHRGEKFTDAIEASDWRPVLEPVVAATGTPIPGPGASPWQLSAAIYRHEIERNEEAGTHDAPSFIWRLYPLALERHGDRARAQGNHAEALARWLVALDAWQGVLDWSQDERERLRALGVEDPGSDNRIWLAEDAYERNEGLLRRKSRAMAEALAEDPAVGTELSSLINRQAYAEASELLAKNSWKPQAELGHGVIWYDELPEQK